MQFRQISGSICFFSFLFFACNNGHDDQSLIKSFDLKRGEIVSCGPPDAEFGKVAFGASVPEKFQNDFNIAVAMLHSFEYDEAEKMFARVIDGAPDCAMAYWGVAMSNFHPLWAPPTPEELRKGAIAVQFARNARKKTDRESGYIEAMAAFFEDTVNQDHRSRVARFSDAMEKVYDENPDDAEAAIFYSLALNAAADPTDKSFANQKKAIGILNKRLEKEPSHPGIVHYIIHNADYPELASMALQAARKYASLAPASAHAQHMPSHIFTRLGLWDECIQSNLDAAASAKCYAEQAKIKGHWDEELHATDYLMYAYLQKADDASAKQQLDYLSTIKEIHPANFKVAYAFAAMPSRYFLEKRMWKEAANLELYSSNVPWEKFPWQKAIVHFARLMGAVNVNELSSARKELDELRKLQEALSKQKNVYKEREQVEVQIRTGEAWIKFREGDNEGALKLMTSAADMEDGLEKHPVTPGEVIPARELLGDMLLAMNRPAEALLAYEADLARHQNRFNGLYGAAVAAVRSGDMDKAGKYYKKLIEIVGEKGTERAEVKKARAFLVRG